MNNDTEIKARQRIIWLGGLISLIFGVGIVVAYIIPNWGVAAASDEVAVWRNVAGWKTLEIMLGLVAITTFFGMLALPGG